MSAKSEMWRRNRDNRSPRSRPKVDDQLVDSNLSEECRQAARAVEFALIRDVTRRSFAAFLGEDDCQETEDQMSPLMASLMLECLSRFVHKCGGQIASVTNFTECDEAVNPVVRAVKVGNAERRFLCKGHMFIHLPKERVVVSVAHRFTPMEEAYVVRVVSNKDSEPFYRDWGEHARRDNYLRGRAFFADGEVIEREKRLSWDDVLLPGQTRQMIRLHVDDFLRNSELLRKLGLKSRRGLILEGPPGTGKTLLGKVLADNVEASFIWVTPRHVAGADSFAEILTLARFLTPAILFLEDLDLFGEEREGRAWLGLGELMNQLDGALDNEDIVTIATTNRIEVVEKALRNRPGRFDRVIHLDAMEGPCRRKMLAGLLAQAAIAPGDFEHLVEASDGCTGAQVEELANTICLMSIARESTKDGSPQAINVSRQSIEAALIEVHGVQKRGIGFNAGAA